MYFRESERRQLSDLDEGRKTWRKRSFDLTLSAMSTWVIRYRKLISVLGCVLPEVSKL